MADDQNSRPTTHQDPPASHDYEMPSSIHTAERLTFPVQLWMPPYGQPPQKRVKLKEHQHLLSAANGQGWQCVDEEVPVPLRQPTHSTTIPTNRKFKQGYLGAQLPVTATMRMRDSGGHRQQFTQPPPRPNYQQQTIYPSRTSMYHGSSPIRTAVTHLAHTTPYSAENPYTSSSGQLTQGHPYSMHTQIYANPLGRNPYDATMQQEYHSHAPFSPNRSIQQAASDANNSMADYSRLLYGNISSRATRIDPQVYAHFAGSSVPRHVHSDGASDMSLRGNTDVENPMHDSIRRSHTQHPTVDDNV